MKAPTTTDEFFALPIRQEIMVTEEVLPNGVTLRRPVVRKGYAYSAEPDTVFLGHDADGFVFVLGLDEEGFCRRPWR